MILLEALVVTEKGTELRRSWVTRRLAKSESVVILSGGRQRPVHLLIAPPT